MPYSDTHPGFLGDTVAVSKGLTPSGGSWNSEGARAGSHSRAVFGRGGVERFARDLEQPCGAGLCGPPEISSARRIRSRSASAKLPKAIFGKRSPDPRKPLIFPGKSASWITGEIATAKALSTASRNSLMLPATSSAPSLPSHHPRFQLQGSAVSTVRRTDRRNVGLKRDVLDAIAQRWNTKYTAVEQCVCPASSIR